MKRLLQISLDTLLASLLPIFSWLLLGLIIDKNLINVFTITYPIQFIYGIFKSVFATGANISKEEDKNKNAVLSAMTIGIILGSIIFGFLIYNVDNYITFMNMDPDLYKTFTIYSFVQIFLQLILEFVLMKNYYENKFNQANKYSVIFNLLNFFVLIGSSLIFEKQVYIVLLTLFITFSYTIIIVVKTYSKFKFKLNIINLIKYDSVELFNQLLFFIIFLFGLSNVIEYGAKYVLALTFVALITDAQWDIYDSITTAAKIDISKNKFNYKEHKKNAYKLLVILLISIFIMFISLYKFYKLNLFLTIVFLSFEIFNFIIYPIYKIKTCFLQLEYSPLKTTSNKIVASLSRVFLSFLKTPYCTGIGQVISSLYQYITINIMFNKNFKILKNGNIIKK